MTDYEYILEVLKSQNSRKRKNKMDWEKIKFEEKNGIKPEINLPNNDICFIFTKHGRLKGICNYKE